MECEHRAEDRSNAGDSSCFYSQSVEIEEKILQEYMFFGPCFAKSCCYFAISQNNFSPKWPVSRKLPVKMQGTGQVTKFYYVGMYYVGRCVKKNLLCQWSGS